MNKTLRDIGSLSVISGVGLVAGLVTQTVIAGRFGVGSKVDILFAAQTVPAFVFGQLAFCLGTSFLPVLARVMERKGERGAWDYASNFLNSVALVGLLLGLALVVNARALVALFVPRLAPAEIPLAVTVFQIAVMSGFLHCLFQLVSYLHYHENRFLLVGAAGLLVNVCALIGAICFTSAGIYAIALGLLAGHALKLGVVTRGFGRHYRFRLSWRCEGSRRTYRAASPMLASVAVGKADPLIERLVASGLPVGAISSLGYAGKIVSSLAAVTTQGVGTVIFPKLARLAAADQQDRVGEILARYVGQTFLAVMPLGAFMAFFRKEIVRLLFERGAFTPAMTDQVATVVLCYCGMYVLSGTGSLLSRGFYISGKTHIPAAIAVIGSGVYLVLALLFSRVMGVAGIALAFSLQFLYGLLAQIVMLRRIYPSFSPGSVLLRAVEYGGWAGLSGHVARWAMERISPAPVHPLSLLVTLGLGTVALAVVYFGGLLLVREPEIMAAARYLHLRFPGRRRPLAAPMGAPLE